MARVAFAVYSLSINTEHSVFHKKTKESMTAECSFRCKWRKKQQEILKKRVKQARDVSKTLPTAAKEKCFVSIQILSAADELYRTTGRGWYTN